MACAAEIAAAAVLAAGCVDLRDHNAGAWVARPTARSEQTVTTNFKAHFLYPARDIALLDPLWRRVAGDPAWNADADFDAGTAFCRPWAADELTPEACALGPCTRPPVPPWRVGKVKDRGGSRGFFGTDATDRKFLVKLDDPRYPELGTSSSVIGSRILWALGYRVPATYLVEIEGTGDARFDGLRATATEFLPASGTFAFDWFRYRREAR